MAEFKRVETVLYEGEKTRAEVRMAFRESEVLAQSNAESFGDISEELRAGLTPVDGIVVTRNPDEVTLSVESRPPAGSGYTKVLVLDAEEFRQLWRLLERMHRDGVFDQELWHSHPRGLPLVRR